MLHLRTDWQGIQDVRQGVLVDLVKIEDQLDDGEERYARDGLTELIDKLALLAGASPSDLDNREFGSGSSILEDEPVFLVRAKDPCCVAAVQAWAGAAAAMGCDKALFDRVMRWADQMRDWQQAHNPKPHAPDAPELLPDPEAV